MNNEREREREREKEIHLMANGQEETNMVKLILYSETKPRSYVVQ